MIPLLLTLAAPLPAAQDDHPVRHDRTGIVWTVPFSAARARAEEEGRLLLIKPVAFGTTAGGCW